MASTTDTQTVGGQGNPAAKLLLTPYYTIHDPETKCFVQEKEKTTVASMNLQQNNYGYCENFEIFFNQQLRQTWNFQHIIIKTKPVWSTGELQHT